LKKDQKEVDTQLQELGQRIKQVRETLKLQQTEFAAKLSFSRRLIIYYEKGEAKPGYDFFQQCAEIYNINPAFLLIGKGAMFISDNDGEDLLEQWFGDYIPNEVEKTFLEYFRKSQLVRLNVNAYFRSFLINNRELIEKDIADLNQFGINGNKKKPTE
jgi:transcriptional regulator with XRE-family HTH domain